MKWILLAPLMLLGALLALTLLAMLLRVGAGASYRNGQPRAWAKIGPVNIPLYPRKKKQKPKKDRRGKPASKGKAAQQPETRPKAEGQEAPPPPVPQKKEKPPAGGRSLTVEDICAYARFGIDAGGRLLRGLRIDKLYLRADIGTPDAAKTALAYGRASAAVSSLWPLMERLFTIRKKDIFLNACFEREQTVIEGEIIITAMVGRMAVIGLCVFRQFTKMKKGGASK